MRKVLAAKLHGIRVTHANLDYHGSITLDPDHCEAAGLLPLEFVEIWNKHSGARISTYVIYGKRGSRICCLNGAAARTAQVGDALIICSSHYIEAEHIAATQPRVVVLDEANHICDQLHYKVSHDEQGRLTFDILSSNNEAQPVPLKVRP
jgi:aspartate 1-decarboxylase